MHSVRAVTLRATGLALAGTAVAAVAAACAPFGWPFELFSHFRWQVSAAALTLLLAAAVLRRPWMMAVAAATLALQAVGQMPRSVAAPAMSGITCSGAPLRVVTANVQFSNTDPAALLAWLVRSEADIIALQEVTPQWAGALQSLASTYPHRKVVARDDPYGIALLSRWPVRSIETADFAADGLPSLVAMLDVRDDSVQVIALHTRWPVLPSLLAARNRSLQHAAAAATALPDSTILLGDLNLTPYAPAFTQLVAASGLRDALADEAWRPTWLAGFWPLALPLDHVLVPRGSCPVAHEIGPDIGSDHRPLQVTLRLR